MPSRELATEALPEAIVDLYPYDGGYSVMGVDAESAVGLLGLLLFIDLMRVLSSLGSLMLIFHDFHLIML